jgi:hypothetical protein
MLTFKTYFQILSNGPKTPQALIDLAEDLGYEENMTGTYAAFKKERNKLYVWIQNQKPADPEWMSEGEDLSEADVLQLVRDKLLLDADYLYRIVEMCYTWYERVITADTWIQQLIPLFSSVDPDWHLLLLLRDEDGSPCSLLQGLLEYHFEHESEQFIYKLIELHTRRQPRNVCEFEWEDLPISPVSTCLGSRRYEPFLTARVLSKLLAAGLSSPSGINSFLDYGLHPLLRNHQMSNQISTLEARVILNGMMGRSLDNCLPPLFSEYQHGRSECRRHKWASMDVYDGLIQRVFTGQH